MMKAAGSIVSDEDYDDSCENGGKDVWGKLLDAGAFLDESVSKVDNDVNNELGPSSNIGCHKWQSNQLTF